MDGERWRVIPADVMRAVGVVEDDEVDLDALGATISQAEPGCARKRALRLLGYRERSAHEVADRLAADGYSPDTVNNLLRDLTSTGLIDDTRFAQALARTMVCVRRMGRARIAAELMRRGIDGSTATAALAECCDASSEAERAATLAATLARTCGQDPVRVTRRLIARGYPPHMASQAASKACERAAHLRQRAVDS